MTIDDTTCGHSKYNSLNPVLPNYFHIEHPKILFSNLVSIPVEQLPCRNIDAFKYVPLTLVLPDRKFITIIILVCYKEISLLAISPEN